MAYTITSGLSQFLGGWLGDRVSRQITITIGLAGVGLATLAVGLSPAYYPMLLILVMMGIFAGAYHPSAIPMLSTSSEKSMRGKAIAFHMVGGSIGFAVGPILGGVIAEVLGWHFAFIILSIPILVAIPLVLKRFRQQERLSSGEPISHVSTTDGTPVEAMPRRTGIVQVLRPIAAVLTLVILTQFVAGSAMAFIPIYLVDKHSIAAASAAMWLGIMRGGGIAGSLMGGWLSDKWGRKNALLLALVTTGPILYLLTKLPFNVALIVVLILLGFLMLMRQATIQPLLMDSTPPHLRGTVFGIYFGLSMEGMSLLQPAVGYFMDIFGIIEVFNVIALIGIALSVVTLFLAKRPKLRR